MVDAPEKIRVAQDADGFWTCREAVSGSQEYVRADLYAALEAQLAEAKAAMRAVYDWMNQLPIPTTGCTSKMQLLYDALSALEATSGAGGDERR